MPIRKICQLSTLQTVSTIRHAHLYRIFSLRKMLQFLLLLYSLQTRLMGGQPSPDGAGLLRAEIQMDVFLASARHAEVVTREGINYSENPSNRFAYIMAVG